MIARITVAATLIAGLAIPALGATISSPPVWIEQNDGQSIRCMSTNLGTKEIEALVQVVDIAGNVANSLNVALVAGASSSAGFQGFNGLLRCVITGKFSKRKMAVTACARVTTTGVSETCVSSGP